MSMSDRQYKLKKITSFQNRTSSVIQLIDLHFHSINNNGRENK